VDTVARHDEVLPGTPLLRRVWEDDAPLHLPTLAEVRAHARDAVAALPDEARRPRGVAVPISAGLLRDIEALVAADDAVSAAVPDDGFDQAEARYAGLQAGQCLVGNLARIVGRRQKVGQGPAFDDQVSPRHVGNPPWWW